MQIHILDVNSLFNNVLADPSLYGLKDVSHAQISTDPNGSGFLFWDTVHPTTQVDQIIGGVAAQSVPEPSSVIVFGVGLLLISGSARWRGRVRIASAP